MVDINKSPTETNWLKRIAVAIVAVCGIFTGLGAYTFHYAEGFSYFSSDPHACVNCHIMQPQFDSWQKSSHQNVASCVDCHLPNGFISKYISKAENGYHHSREFTFQNFKEPIQIKPKNQRILEANCIDCHTDMTEVMLSYGQAYGVQPTACTHCHMSVGHGERAGLGGPETRAERRGIMQ